MTNAKRLYLRDVLGIHNWIRSEDSPVSLQTAQIPSASRSASPLPVVVVIRKANWRIDQNQLVDRILASVHLENSPVSDDVRVNARNVVVFDSAAPIGKVAGDQQVIWNLGQLSAMQEGAPESIQATKREVWTLLKTLKDSLKDGVAL